MSVRSNPLEPLLYSTTAVVNAAALSSSVIFSKVFGEGHYLISGSVNVSANVAPNLLDIVLISSPTQNLYNLSIDVASGVSELTVPVTSLWYSDGVAPFAITVSCGVLNNWDSGVTQLQVAKLSL